MSDRPNATSTTESFEFDALEYARNYRATLIREFAPWLKGGVLEVGAGIGQMTSVISQLPAVERLTALEPESRFCQSFRTLCPQLKVIEGCLETVSIEPDWDAVVCINVLEHIREDAAELARFHQKLSARSGHLCLFVPARQEIYAPIDKDFGHFRRYARPALRALLKNAGFQIVRLHYFNFIGYFAWWLSFCVLKKRVFETGSVALFDRFIFPWASALERKIVRPPLGQSLLAVARAAK